jgi:hypothetical protein
MSRIQRIQVELPPRISDGTQQSTAVESPFGFQFNLPQTTTKKAAGKRTVYPIVPDPDGTLAKMAASYKVNKEKMEAAEAECESIRPRIIEKTFPYWCKVCSGREESTHLSVQSPEGEILVVPIDKYGAATPEAILKCVGPDILKAQFKPRVTITIKSDNLPEGAPTQALFNDLVALMARHGQSAALEIKQLIVPRKGFVDVRHRILSPEQNCQLNEVCPTQVQLKCKGRGE